MIEDKFHIEDEGIVEHITDEPDEQCIVNSPLEELDHVFLHDLSFIQEQYLDWEVEEPLDEPLPPARLVTVDIERLRRHGVPEYVISVILENEEDSGSIMESDRDVCLDDFWGPESVELKITETETLTVTVNPVDATD